MTKNESRTRWAGTRSHEPRVGFGVDIHPFKKGRPLILGGVKIPHPKGLEGHSDADVLIHAIMDALLGAAGLGDIGRHFPSTDEYRGISSLVLLEKVKGLLKKKRRKIRNIDATLVLEAPKIASYISKMEKNISKSLGVTLSQINVKATRAEGLGFIGHEEGAAAYAVCLLSPA